jgi:hypothetical protein
MNGESLFDLQNKAYELFVLWQRSLHTKEPNHNGSKPSLSFQLVRFYLLLGKLWSTPTTWEQILLPRNRDFLQFPLTSFLVKSMNSPFLCSKCDLFCFRMARWFLLYVD